MMPAAQQKQCEGEDAEGNPCPSYGSFISSKNWARHTAAYENYHERSQPILPKEQCPICLKEVAKGTLSRHHNTLHPELPARKRRRFESSVERDTKASEEEYSESGDDDDDDFIGHRQLKGVRGGPAQTSSARPLPLRSRPKTPDLTLQKEVFEATKNARQRSLTAIKAYVENPEPSTDVIKAANTANSKNHRRRTRKVPNPVDSRGAFEMPIFFGYMDSSVNVFPLSASQYHERKDDFEKLKSCYVVCTPREARAIIEQGVLRIPLLVRWSKETYAGFGDLDTIDSFLAYLLTKATKIDVHRYNKPISDPAYMQPEPMPTAEAISLFRDPKSSLVNFLNLGNVKDNPVPGFMQGIRAIKLLKEITEDNLIGKREKTNWSDLSSCCAFHILAKAGVFSMPHRDHHGVITTATCDEGEKYWLTWPAMTAEEMEEWTDQGSEDAFAPPGTPFGIYLRQGDVLVQPRGRVHAPYSMTDVLMSGTMHWDSRDMKGVLQDSIFEAQNEQVTNEGTAVQFSSKMQEIDGLWKVGSPMYPWASEEEYEDWVQLLDVSGERFSE
jgi:hypothetical protein